MFNLSSIHYPASKNPEYTKYRQIVTNEYALLTTVIVGSIVLIGIPCWKYISSSWPVDVWSKLNIGKWLLLKSQTEQSQHHHLHQHQHQHQDQDQVQELGAPESQSLKRKINTWLFFHSTTIFQLSFWLCVLCSLLFINLNNGDLVFLAKRLGKIPTVCLPTILFLSIRPSPLPNVLYLLLLPIHKWISRIVIVQSVIHMVLYMGYFKFKNTWYKALTMDNIYGWIALLGFLVIIVTSLPYCRNRWYKTFYFNHYIWSWIIVICIQFHARPVKVTWYTAANLSILVGQVLYRLKLTRATPYFTDFQVIDILPNISLIEFPNELISKPAVNPGAHIRITTQESNIFGRLYKQFIPNYHPYTLVSLPLDSYQRLIVRKGGNFKLLNDRKYLICGSYDPHLLMMENKKKNQEKFSISNLKLNLNRLLIVVGGSAISFALPIIRVMNYHGIPIKCIWVVRDFKDIVLLNHFSDYIQGDDFEIFITGEYNHDDIFNLGAEEVEIAINDESEDEGEECCSRFTAGSPEPQLQIPNEASPLLQNIDNKSLKSGKSGKSGLSRKSSMSSIAFELPPETSNYFSNLYSRTLLKLNLENKIYQGRPTLNHRYYQWCMNESNFTQCSGPVDAGDNTFICCKDVLDKNRSETLALGSSSDLSNGKASNINCWVVSAGPKNLVRNVGLWARENGLKFHEESFSI